MSIAILDAGAQYGKLIDRRIRELNVETDLLAIDTPLELLTEYKGIIISGGPDSVMNELSLDVVDGLFELDIPILGICYGMQLIAKKFGGTLASGFREDGQYTIQVDTSSPLYQNLQKKQKVMLTHGDSVIEVDDSIQILSVHNFNYPVIHSIQIKGKHIYGVQFHPEVDLTENGRQIFTNFLFDICHCEKIAPIQDRLSNIISTLKEEIGDRKVVALLSGGVDSTVCASLLMRATEPEKLAFIHIDNGFMRMNESRLVVNILKENGINITIVNASETFYENLGDTIKPEEKRRIIGDTFMMVSQREIEKLGDDVLLVQGTLRPDLIESASHLASGKASTIKTHHNDTPLVRKMRSEGRIIEPLKDFHKDEVREIGTQLGLPDELVYRHPFPGPGLAIRILCAEMDVLDGYAKTRSELSKHALNGILLPIKSVGVQGDHRSYKYVCGLIHGDLLKNWDIFYDMAKTIPQRVDVNRVVYFFGDTYKGMHVTPTHLYSEEVDLIRQADYTANQILQKYTTNISQCPIVLLPVSFDEIGGRSIVIRTIITNDFMTGKIAVPDKDIPMDCIREMVDELMKIDGLSRVGYDLTDKPPGTVEWE